MPGKTWDPEAERDLIWAAWSSNSAGEFKADWTNAHQQMIDWGYEFTKEALSQRWSKKVYKEFRERRDQGPNQNSGKSAEAPLKKPTKPAGKTTGKRTHAETSADGDGQPAAKKTARASKPRARAPAKKAAPVDAESVDGGNAEAVAEDDDDNAAA